MLRRADGRRSRAPGSRLRAAAGFAGALAAALLLGACGRVPEQALKDEQARSRRYRDAYESLHDELQALRARVAELERREGCKVAQSPDAGQAASPR